ncbi:MAG: hypothetical protein M1837_004150 [Sclerophora amabilis]|nr:MAG: hypothetical protein M1837_004150 [Sclerophora amabilis]
MRLIFLLVALGAAVANVSGTSDTERRSPYFFRYLSCSDEASEALRHCLELHGASSTADVGNCLVSTGCTFSKIANDQKRISTLSRQLGARAGSEELGKRDVIDGLSSLTSGVVSFFGGDRKPSGINRTPNSVAQADNNEPARTKQFEGQETTEQQRTNSVRPARTEAPPETNIRKVSQESGPFLSGEPMTTAAASRLLTRSKSAASEPLATSSTTQSPTATSTTMSTITRTSTLRSTSISISPSSTSLAASSASGASSSSNSLTNPASQTIVPISDSSNEGMNTAAIAAISAVAGLVALSVIAIAFCLFRRRKRRSGRVQDVRDESLLDDAAKPGFGGAGVGSRGIKDNRPESIAMSDRPHANYLPYQPPVYIPTSIRQSRIWFQSYSRNPPASFPNALGFQHPDPSDRSLKNDGVSNTSSGPPHHSGTSVLGRELNDPADKNSPTAETRRKPIPPNLEIQIPLSHQPQPTQVYKPFSSLYQPPDQLRPGHQDLTADSARPDPPIPTQTR